MLTAFSAAGAYAHVPQSQAPSFDQTRVEDGRKAEKKTDENQNEQQKESPLREINNSDNLKVNYLDFL